MSRKLVIIIILALGAGIALAQTSQTLTGTVKVSTAPSVTAIYLFADDNGGTTTQTTTLTPYDEMTLVITIEDPDGLDTLQSIKIVIYHSSTTLDGIDDPALHATITWDATNGWSLSPSGTTWALDTENSSVPTTDTVGNVTIVFTPGKVTRFSDTGDWTIYVEVTDAQGLTGTGQLTNLNVAFYAEVYVSATSFDFGLVAPGVQNKSLETPTGGYINVTVIANDDFGIKVTGEGWYNATGALIVNFNTFNSLLVDDDANPVEATETSKYPFWVRSPTTVTDPQWTGFGSTTEAGYTIQLYLYVTLPSDIPPGTYTTTITVTVVQQ